MPTTLTRTARLLRLHPGRLLVAPRLEVTAVAGDRAEVAIHGLVCGLCAGRTRAALLATAGVEAAGVDLDAGTATLRLAPGAAVDAEAMQRSLDRVVIAVRARRVVEQIAGILRASTLWWRGRRAREGRSG